MIVVIVGIVGVVSVGGGCGVDVDAQGFTHGTSGGSSETGDTPGTSSSSVTGSSGGTDSADTTDSGEPPVQFDLGNTLDVPTGPGNDICKVGEDGRDVGTCREQAPPDAFEPDVQWSWSGAGLTEVYVTPLVGNLTDDNDDGEIDLCDIPDVVVVAAQGLFEGARIVVLSGDDGSVHYEIPVPVNLSVTPALGDIDGDGLLDIVAVAGDFPDPGFVVAFDHLGNTKWQSESPAGGVMFAGPTLADLDGDGTVEILVGGAVYDADGVQQFETGVEITPAIGSLVTTADLDNDGDQEIVHGATAYHHDGSLYYDAGIPPGFPHIGNFDADDDPEILVMNEQGINLLDHKGAPIWLGQRPTGDPAETLVWLKPGTIHDFDGDGDAEFATGSANNYAMYEIDATGPTIVWQALVLDESGSAGGTAFDFDGDGIAEAMYADEAQMFVYDGMGAPLFTTPRQSLTGLEYPVVADVDNDGSAEIVVVSNQPAFGGVAMGPAVQVIRDIEDRWIPARRIWNQHAYHVSNVREDGTIPSTPAKSWLELNTFRTNAQVENGGVCQPVPAG